MLYAILILMWMLSGYLIFGLSFDYVLDRFQERLADQMEKKFPGIAQATASEPTKVEEAIYGLVFKLMYLICGLLALAAGPLPLLIPVVRRGLFVGLKEL